MITLYLKDEFLEQRPTTHEFLYASRQLDIVYEDEDVLVINDSKIYIAASKGNGYAPIYIGMEDGSPITLEMEPHETADMTLNVNVTASLDVKAVFGTKLAVITVA